MAASGPDGAIDRLIALVARLPGLGPRSARRAVLHLIRKRDLLLLPLADALAEVAHTVRTCSNCGNVATADLCKICSNPERQNGILCVVEDIGDLWAMERAAIFKGRYHILGGTLSALEERSPEDLGLPRLSKRLVDENVREVILALSATVDGQTTAHYIADLIGGSVKVTSLAQGVPVGGELDYLDDGTITAAMQARRAL